MKKLLLLPLLLLGLPACELLCTDCCGSKPMGRYDVNGALLTATTVANGNLVVLGPDAQLKGTALELRLALQTLIVAARRTGGGGMAYACSPADPTPIQERLDSVAITSRFDFDAQHPAGTPLNDLLEVQRFYNGQQTLVALTTYLAGQQGQPEDQLVLKFAGSGSPASARQQFRVFYRLTNGEEYIAETVSLQLN